MTQPTPKHKYVIIHPKDENDVDMKFSFMLVLSKKIDKTVGPKLAKALATLDGIDSFQDGVGLYTWAVSIARTFDPDDVISELKRRLEEEVLSDIVRPQIITPI